MPYISNHKKPNRTAPKPPHHHSGVRPGTSPSKKKAFEASNKRLSEHARTRLSKPTEQPAHARMVKIPDDRQLKAIGHQLKPCMIVTETSFEETLTTDGVSQTILKESVKAELMTRLEDHELIKVKIRIQDRGDRTLALETLIAASDSRLIHKIGHNVLLLRPSTRFSRKLSNIERHLA